MNNKEKLNAIMLKILPFEEFRQNDVVENQYENRWTVIGYDKYKQQYLTYYMELDNSVYHDAKDLKLISSLASCMK